MVMLKGMSNVIQVLINHDSEEKNLGFCFIFQTWKQYSWKANRIS